MIRQLTLPKLANDTSKSLRKKNVLYCQKDVTWITMRHQMRALCISPPRINRVIQGTKTAGGLFVCVCLYHQKVKLMLEGCKFPIDQHSLTEMIVCSRINRECIIDRCGKCPGLEPENMKKYEKVCSKEADLDSDDVGSGTSKGEKMNEQEVRFSHWVSTDRADIVKERLLVLEFLDLLVEKLYDFTHHSFTGKSTRGICEKNPTRSQRR